VYSLELADIETKGALRLILFLHESKKPVKITDIKIGVTQNTVYRILGILLRLELVDEHREPPYTRYIELTDDGKKMAQKIKEMKEILDAKVSRQKSQPVP
jgi:Mn-dependent DtxR family transcriptional regulator